MLIYFEWFLKKICSVKSHEEIWWYFKKIINEKIEMKSVRFVSNKTLLYIPGLLYTETTFIFLNRTAVKNVICVFKWHFSWVWTGSMVPSSQKNSLAYLWIPSKPDDLIWPFFSSTYVWLGIKVMLHNEAKASIKSNFKFLYICRRRFKR